MEHLQQEGSAQRAARPMEHGEHETPLQRAWATVRGERAAFPAHSGATTDTATDTRAWHWEGPALLVVLAVSAALNFYGLTNEGYANEYYAAAVRSMLQSWHNFFFVSFDPGGFVTVDKPPLGFMIQTLSAKIFGHHGWSILLPQALAGVAAVALLYYLVRRVWGPLAGLVAASALAVSPISVVTSRNNTIDSLLALTSLLAVWAVTRAIESGRHPFRWLLLAGTFVGLGFNIKMLEAYLVVPALWLAYLLIARSRWYVRIGHLLAATLLLVVVSLSWATVVDLTPASARPYVGSSQTNSVLELALGYNGLQRLLGRGGTVDTLLSSEATSFGGFGGGGVGGASENGPKGLLRLIDTQLGGQIGWLTPLAVVGLAAAAWTLRPRRLRSWRLAANPTGSGPLRRRRASFVIWGTWFVTMGTFFSIASFFHRYYTTMLAPGLVALVGIGVALLWRAWQRPGTRAQLLRGGLGWALPLVLIGTVAVQAHILASYTTWAERLDPVIYGLSLAAAVVFVVARLLIVGRGAIATGARGAGRVALAAGLAAVLLSPTVWSAISVQAASGGGNSSMPTAGPAGSDRMGGGFGNVGGGQPPSGQAGGFGPRGFGQANSGQASGQAGRGIPGMNGAPNGGQARTGDREIGGAASGAVDGRGGGNATAPATEAAQPGRNFGGGGRGGLDTQTLQWLIANRGNAQYIVAVSSAMSASSAIIETGEPIMATGGFSGSDPILNAESLAQLVKDGTVRFFITGGGMGGERGGGFNVDSWVTQHCTAVPASTTGSTQTIYDCSAAR
jgi:4-amino-4-deoxy-L-arabinose transferase-like glycosyltransferase